LARSEGLLSAVAGALCADKSCRAILTDTVSPRLPGLQWDYHVVAGVRRIPGRASAEMAAPHQGSQYATAV